MLTFIAFIEPYHTLAELCVGQVNTENTEIVLQIAWWAGWVILTVAAVMLVLILVERFKRFTTGQETMRPEIRVVFGRPCRVPPEKIMVVLGRELRKVGLGRELPEK